MAADTISASRPGARRDTFETYIKRLETLENLANSFDGVEKSYAIQAGREVRLIVNPEKITDDEMVVLAKEVAEKVENEMAFPGQIKINVIRETRTTDYAKQSKVHMQKTETETKDEENMQEEIQKQEDDENKKHNDSNKKNKNRKNRNNRNNRNNKNRNKYKNKK